MIRYDSILCASTNLCASAVHLFICSSASPSDGWRDGRLVHQRIALSQVGRRWLNGSSTWKNERIQNGYRMDTLIFTQWITNESQMNHKWIMNPWLWMALDGMVMLHVSNVFCETKLWELECHDFLWWQLSKETCMWMVRHIQMQYLYPCHPSGYATCSWTNLFEILSDSVEHGRFERFELQSEGLFLKSGLACLEPQPSEDMKRSAQATQWAC